MHSNNFKKIQRIWLTLFNFWKSKFFNEWNAITHLKLILNQKKV